MLWKYFVAVLGYLAVCQADLPVTPPAPPRVYCGEVPGALLECLGHPQIVRPDIPPLCAQKSSHCERIRCVFDKSGWLDASGKVDTSKVASYFEEYAREHPAWSPAVQQVKSNCLQGALLAQGVHVGCVPDDVLHCALTQFVKHATPSQWSKSSSCDYPRQFAQSCPLCPSDCFAPQVPAGSCNACRGLTRAP